MLGGLGKLAADGLAYRTEKATEEAGKDPKLLSNQGHSPQAGGLGTNLTGPVGS